MSSFYFFSESDDSFDALIFNLFKNLERRKEETKYPFPSVNYARKKLQIGKKVGNHLSQHILNI